MSDPQTAPRAPLNVGSMQRLWANLERLLGSKYKTYRWEHQTNSNRDADGAT